MVTLLGYSLELVRKGETTLEEVGRMVLMDSGLDPSAEPVPSAQSPVRDAEPVCRKAGSSAPIA